MILKNLAGKRVIVTGHTGFKGSWLSVWLSKLAAEVAGFSLYIPSDPSHFDLIPKDVWKKDYRGDVREFNELKKVFDEFKPEVIFHLAASPIVRHCLENPLEAYSTNVMGTANILECIRQSDCVQAAVLITSDKCYENVEWLYGYRENDSLGGKDPYSSSKAAAEMVISTYQRSYFENTNIKIASARAGNVIGGGDWAKDRIIPDAIRAWEKEGNLELRAPNSTRPWQHVLEPLGGYLLLASALIGGDTKTIGQAFNFGPKDTSDKTVGEIISYLSKFFNGSYAVVQDAGVKNEAGLLKLNCDKALSILGWKSILSYEEALDLTGEWFKAYLNNPQNTYQVTLSQIENYTNSVLNEKHNWLKE